MRMYRWLPLFVFCSVVPSAWAQQEADPDTAAKKIDQHLQAATDKGFSGAVLVYQKGKTILAKGYGLADRTKKIPVTRASLFDIGSLSKQFTAAAILKLEMQGKLSTDDLASKYIGKMPEDKKGITIHHLLTHTSGIMDRQSGGWRNVRQKKREEFIKVFKASKMATKPGEAHSYTNLGYSVLAAIVEIASGQSLEDYTSKYLFEPAGMKSTGFCHGKGLNRANLVRGYIEDEDKGYASDAPFLWGMRGASGIVTNVDDLLRWIQAIHHGDTLLSEQARKKFFTPYLADYAYGWKVAKTTRDTTLVWHGGVTNYGFVTRCSYYPEEDTLLLTLANSQDMPGLINELPDLVFGKKEYPFVIARVAAGLPADKAGLRPGDVILSYNGKKIDSRPALKQAIFSAPASEKVEIVIRRDEKEMTLKITNGRLGLFPRRD